MKRRLAIAVPLIVLIFALAVPAAFGAGQGTASVGQVFSMPGRLSGAFGDTPAARAKRSRGYLVRDAARLDQLKDLVRPSAPGGNGHGGGGGGGGGGSCATNSLVFASCQGINDTSVTPSDSTGAIGPTRYIELVNLKFGIYTRTLSAVSSGSLASLTGDSGANLSDPQIIWDPGTNRFYYVVLDFSSNILLFGFSTTNEPGSSSDFCKYGINYNYGSNLPDYPKLGDTSDFLLMGVNVFDSSDNFLGSDVDWVTKPPSGTTCPAGTSFTAARHNVSTSSAKIATPVPANQTDPSGTGWVVAGQDPTAPSSGGTGSFIQLFQVTSSNTGAAVITAVTSTVSTSTSFQVPPSAPQPGTNRKLDTLDARLTQAVSAVDPSHSSATGIWTQNTVAGGAGSKVRWYEINPATPTLLQQGEVSSNSLYAFNGAVSPDRQRNGATSMYGDSMVLGFNTSSATSYPAIQMVYKVPGQNQSGFALVVQSPTYDSDFSCSPVCRWGDYSGASPDPAAPAASHGQVWLTNMWNQSSRSFFQAAWRTWKLRSRSGLRERPPG